MQKSLVLLSLLAACADPSGMEGKFGTVNAPMYREQITIRTVLPPDAPSVFQQFRRLPPSRGGPDDRTEHLGIDFVARAGTPVLAAAPGRVTASFRGPGYGNEVVIDHGTDADGKRVRTVYKHMKTRRVAVGDKVVRGQQIGGVGRSGVMASGINHLHFELQVSPDGKRFTPVDPGAWWTGGAGRPACFRGQRPPARPLRITLPVACRA